MLILMHEKPGKFFYFSGRYRHKNGRLPEINCEKA
jgi:hypothetical protein